MPYRRLPNTDQARVRTLKSAVEKGNMYDVRDLAISLGSLSKARSFLAKFETAHNHYVQCYAAQSKASSRHLSNAKNARLYLSHFIQVLNLSVIRGEIKKNHRELYGLPDNNNVPDLLSESSIINWGQKVIEGERKRLLQGGIAIYNPTIAKVKVHYDIFMESYERQKSLQALTADSLERLSSLRENADQLILDIWNQVEEKFANVLPNDVRLAKCREYGLIYYYRANEKRND